MMVYLLYDQWFSLEDIDRDGDMLVGIYDDFEKAKLAAKEYVPTEERVTQEEENVETTTIELPDRKVHRYIRKFDGEDIQGDTYAHDIYIVEMEVK